MSSDGELWAALLSEWMLFVNFALSFVLLCLMWMVHVSQFEHIARVDNVMIWLNNGRLLIIVLVPFSTRHHHRVLGVLRRPDHAGGELLPGDRLQLPAVDDGRSVTASRSCRISSQEDAVAYGRGNLSALILSGTVLVLSPFIGSIAFTVFLLDGFLTRRLHGKGDD